MQLFCTVFIMGLVTLLVFIACKVCSIGRAAPTKLEVRRATHERINRLEESLGMTPSKLYEWWDDRSLEAELEAARYPRRIDEYQAKGGWYAHRYGAPRRSREEGCRWYRLADDGTRVLRGDGRSLPQ
jgi:hypothetical protein